MKTLTTCERAVVRRATRSNRPLRRLVLWLAAISPGGVALSFLLAAAVTRDEMLLIFGLAFLLGGMIPAGCLGIVTFYEGIIQKLVRALCEKGVDLEGFCFFEAGCDERVPRGAPGGEEHQGVLERLPRSDGAGEQADREAGSQSGRASTSTLSPWEIQLVERARRCNIYSAQIVTAVSLFLGMLLGMGLLVLSLWHGWRNLVIAAALWLSIMPIFFFARYVIVTLFHIIQKLTSQVGQVPRA